jgi:hypothetical protein
MLLRRFQLTYSLQLMQKAPAATGWTDGRADGWLVCIILLSYCQVACQSREHRRLKLLELLHIFPL